MRILMVLLMTLALLGGAAIAAAQTEEGTANFYGDKFQGKKTASGEVFDKNSSPRPTRSCRSGPR